MDLALCARTVFGTMLPLLAAIALSSGCVTSSPDRLAPQLESAALRDRLLALGDGVAPQEAARLAEAAVQKSMELAQEYRAVRPAWLHNYLVNYRLRDRGLCYDWANDLFATLHELQVTSLELHLAVARMDTRREHNALIVTAQGQPFSEGLVLDAWRRSGHLWSGPARTDKYPWQPLPTDRVAPVLQKLLAGDGIETNEP